MFKPRVEWWLGSRNYLDPHQYGFRKGRSTTDALGLLTTTLYQAQDAGLYSAAASLDIASAYNSVSPHLLLTRLREAGAPSCLRNTIKEVLVHQELYATFGDRREGPRRADKGLAQGWVSSPLLYIFDKRHLCRGLPLGVIAIQFADDIIIIALQPQKQRDGY